MELLARELASPDAGVELASAINPGPTGRGLLGNIGPRLTEKRLRAVLTALLG